MSLSRKVAPIEECAVIRQLGEFPGINAALSNDTVSSCIDKHHVNSPSCVVEFLHHDGVLRGAFHCHDASVRGPGIPSAVRVGTVELGVYDLAAVTATVSAVACCRERPMHKDARVST